MATYKVSAKPAAEGVSNTSFRLGRRDEEGFVTGRIGDEVELSDEQLKQLERSPFEFTAVNSSAEPSQEVQNPQGAQDTQEPQPASEQPETKQ